jgi:hypothetical protein
MKDAALVLARRLSLVISIFALLVTIPFVISPQLATEFGSLRVQRGGSYLCTDQYYSRYSVGARGRGAADTGTNHVGVRCVYDATRPAPGAGANTGSQ